MNPGESSFPHSPVRFLLQPYSTLCDATTLRHSITYWHQNHLTETQGLLEIARRAAKVDWKLSGSEVLF